MAKGVKSFTAQTVLNGDVRVLASPTVTVFEADGVTQATVYADRDGAAGSNPLTGDTQGRVTFYVDPGRYVIQVSKTGYTTQSWEDEIILDEPPQVQSVNSRTGAVTGLSEPGDNVSDFTNDAGYVASADVDTIVQLTQAEYDALSPPVATTLYIVVG